MQIFPTLYKRDSKGNIREWRMEIEGDKYRTVAGLQDGNQVTSEWTVATPKNTGRANATTAEEQAQAEVASTYTKKLDIDYHNRESDVDTPKIFAPMLAQPWERRVSKIDYSEPVYVQPKLDGIRCIVTRHGSFSRKGKPIIAIPHILEALAPVFAENPDAVIDGELYNHELKDDFNTIISIVRRTKLKPEDIERSAQMAQYHVYDFPGLLHEPFDVRLEELHRLCSKPELEPFIQCVPTSVAHSQEEIDECYGKYIEDGYEGGIIRLNDIYHQKRSNSLIKRKDFEEEEFKVLRIEEGSGNWSGCAKRVIFRNDINDDEVGSGLRGTQEFARKLLEEAEQYIGGQATVRFPSRTPGGAPRFGVTKALFKGERDL